MKIPTTNVRRRAGKRRHRVQGLWAWVTQHEVDHLDGILIRDHGEPMPGPAAP